jgi:hypothetical protein
MDGMKNLHPLLLAGNKSMSSGLVEGVTTANLAAFGTHRRHDFFFHFLLRGPALPVRRKAQVAAGDKNDGFAHKLFILTRLWENF